RVQHQSEEWTSRCLLLRLLVLRDPGLMDQALVGAGAFDLGALLPEERLGGLSISRRRLPGRRGEAAGAGGDHLVEVDGEVLLAQGVTLPGVLRRWREQLDAQGTDLTAHAHPAV